MTTATTSGQLPARELRRLWASVVIGTSSVLTLVTALVLGWFAVSFQLAGSVAGRDDYRYASGLYGAAAAVAALAVVGLVLFRAPRWELLGTSAAAFVLALLSVTSWLDAMSAPLASGSLSWGTGVRTLVGCPWAWPAALGWCIGLLPGARQGPSSR